MKLDEIKELMRLFGKSKLDRIQIKQKDFEIEMEKGGTVVVEAAPVAKTAPAVSTAAPTAVPASAPAAEETQGEPVAKGELITSPMVGTFYAAPSPDSPPFVKVDLDERRRIGRGRRVKGPDHGGGDQLSFGDRFPLCLFGGGSRSRHGSRGSGRNGRRGFGDRGRLHDDGPALLHLDLEILLFDLDPVQFALAEKPHQLFDLIKFHSSFLLWFQGLWSALEI